MLMQVKRRTVREERAKRGQFAVFRHTSKLSRAHFAAIHDSYESASAEAVRLLTLASADHPDDQHTYYVVEVSAFFSMGPEGLQSEEQPR